MINVSEQFIQTMRQRRDFRLFALVTLADGTQMQLDGGDFTIAGNSLTDGAGVSGLPLGAAVSRQIRLEIVNDDERMDGYDLFGARIRLWLTLALDETEERVELGTFTVTEPASWGETVAVTAWDDMIRTDKPYVTDLAFPATLGSVFRDACQRCAIPYDTAEFPHEAYLVAGAPDGDYTFRQVLGYIAMLAGGNARVDRSGRMRIIPYGLAAEPVLALEDWSSLKLATDDIIVTGLSALVPAADEDGGVTQTEALYGEEGYVLRIENPLIAPGGEREALALIGAGLVGFPFRQFEGEHAACPMAEFMDTVRITDRKGRTYTSVITDAELAFGGYTSLSNSAEPAVRNGSRYITPETKARLAVRQLVEQERTARQAAVEQLRRTLEESGGMFSTSQTLPDGSTVCYLHDKPTLAASKSVMKLTADAVGLSTDGGRTWPFGFSVNGEMIMGIIRAEGLSADWVRFGTFGQAQVDGLPEMASDLQVLRERITAAVEGVQTLSGQAVSSVTAEYTLSPSNALDGDTGQPVDAAWSEEMPGQVPDSSYLWTRQRISYADGTVGYAGMYCVSGLVQETVEHDISGLQDTLVKNTAELQLVQDRISQQVAQTTANLDNVYAWQSSMEQRASELEMCFQERSVDEVTTSNGFTFNKDGLRVWEDNSQIATVIQNTGMEVRRYDAGSVSDYETMLTANAGGVYARDLTAENYLIIAHARFERYDTDRTGCFYI